MSMDLSGKVALVTGGAKGYGLGISSVLAKRGVNVWATGRDRIALDAAAANLGVEPVVADVTSPSDWDRVFECMAESNPRLDIFVNNAGAGVKICPLAEMSDEDIQYSIAANLTGAVFGCRRAAQIMKGHGGGTIVNVSSVCQREAWPGFSVYSAAKAGLAQLSNCLYTELREFGIRVTTLIPSWGATGFAEAAGLPTRGDEENKKCIQPEELGEMVAMICELPPHLEVQDLTLWPLIQKVVPL